MRKKWKERGKRILAGILVLCMLCPMLPETAFAEDKVAYGDVNKDGEINETDVDVLKQYLAEYKRLDMDTQAADVNADTAIDLKDLLLLEQKVAGLDVILGERVTVTFDTRGGEAVEPIYLCKGATLASVVDKVPATKKDGAVFTGWYVGPDAPFYAEDVLEEDITVYAEFEEVAPKETLSLSSFALEEQSPDLSFDIETDAAMTADAVKGAVSLLVMDGTDPVELEVVQSSGTTFTVKAKEGFTEGSSYQLVLPEGLHFAGKEATIRTANFTIDKEEVANITYNEDIIYIQDTAEMTYQIDGQDAPVDVLEVTALSNREQEEAVTGSFDYAGQELAVGDLLCIYETVSPIDRTDLDYDYSDDAASYIEVTEISGSTISFKAISDEDAEKLFMLPDTIPFSVNSVQTLEEEPQGLSLPAEETGSVSAGAFDTTAWEAMQKTGTPQVNAGDFVVFYEGTFAEITEDTPVYYGEVTSVEGDTIYYRQTTAEAIEKSQELYVEQTVEGEKILEGVDTEALEQQVEEQAMESGFAENAALYLADMAQDTEGFKSMPNQTFSARTADGRTLSAKELAKIGGKWEAGENIKVTATLGKSSAYFQDGISLALRVDAEFSVDVGEDGEMKIELSASFVEEISLDIDTHGNAKIKWYVIIPVLKSLNVGASVDVKNYSAVSVDVKIYTVEKEDEGIWAKLQSYAEEAGVGDLLKEADKLKDMITQATDTVDKINGYKEDLEALWTQISSLTAQNGEELTREDYEGMLEALGQMNVSSELTDLLHLTNEEEIDAGVQNLMERYSEMLETESDWITLVEKTIFEKEQQVAAAVPVLAIAIEMDFVLKANVNIALGANMEYVVGKRYSFWIDIVEKTSGSTTMDLMDEQFAFQFYVMGALGLKMGVKADFAVGLFTTKLGSIGISTEFGPYIKLWGYFIYEFSKLRPANTNQWNYDERMMGALYLEFGIYLEVAFNAQVLDGLISYNPTLYDQEFPLLTVGNQKNYYAFGYELEEDEIVLVNDQDGNSNNGVIMELPENYRQMKYLDLVEGDLEQEVCGYDRYAVTLSNRNFAFDKNTGDITVNVPQGVQYMECDLTLTWKLGKLEFSSRDISVTIPLVWTSLATDELKQRFTSTVKVGNAEDGYVPVWSERQKKNTAFDLPSYEEIMNLIGYDKYDYNGVNLKYADVTGYGDQQTEGLTIYADTTYYFEADMQQYDLTINEIENADGTKTSQTYSAFYGESFHISGLDKTGTSDPATETFTRYLKTEAAQGGTAIDSDLRRVVDKQFARELVDGTVYTAQYVNDSVKAIFSFVGRNVDVDDKMVTVKKGTTPPDVFSSELTEKGISILGINPALGNLSSDTEFVVTGDKYIAPSYTVTYHANGGTEIAGIEVQEGSLLVAPAQPKKEGYLFAGWYTDEALTQEFDFANTKMPGYPLDLYAKWAGKTYEVTLDANEGNLPEGQTNPIAVTYGETYEALPTPVRTGYNFRGWYTSRMGGTLIHTTDTVALSDDITLYAQWEEKQTFSADRITYEPGQGLVYDREGHQFVFETADVDKGSFEVYYKRQVLDSLYGTEARNAGTYDVKLVRQEDDTYKYFETVLTGVYIIEKADSSIITAPTVGEVYYGSVLPTAMTSDVDYIGDGQLQYAITNRRYIAGIIDLIEPPQESDWRNGPVLYNLFDEQSYGARPYLWVRLAEGENYKASGAKVSEEEFKWGTRPKSLLFATEMGDPYKWIVQITTSDIKNAGTDAKIGIRIGNGSYQQLDEKGNDFERGDTNAFQVSVDSNALYNNCYGTIPVTLYYEKKGTSAGWHCQDITIYKVRESDDHVVEGSVYKVNHWFGAEDYNQKNIEEQFEITGFEREITEWGGFEDADNTTNVEVAENADAFTWNWASPSITDSKHKLTYNPYERLNAPELSVTFGNAQYDRYITQGIRGFTVDNAGLYQAMVENQCRNLELNYTLEFKPVNGNASTTEATAKRTKTVTFTCPAVTEPAVTLSEDVNYQLSRSARMLYSLSNGQLANVSSVVQPGENGTFDVVYRLDEKAGIWATKFAVDFDPEKVELQTYTLGDVFAEGEVTVPDENTTDSGRYVFLADKGADGQTFTDTTKTGTLVTLTFQIKDKNLTDYPVTLDDGVCQSINAESGLVTTQVNSNEARIRVSGTTQGIKKEDLIAVQVSGGNKKIEKVQVQRNTDAFEDITASYANGYKVTENGTYTFEVILEDGGKASTSITYENLDNKKPSVQIHADSGEDNTWTAGAVTLTAENTVQNLGDTVIYYRTKDGDTWTRYTEPVTVKPEEVTDVTYSFKAVGENGLESDIVTYRVKVDNASPKAEIKMGQNHWNTFWNNITFGLFFKEIQKVDIHTSDEGSGVDQIAYYLSDKSLSKEEVLNLKAEDWKTGDSFDIKSDNKYVIYTRVVDKAGNRTIISSDGFVLDCKAPVIGGIKDGQTYCQDVEVTVADEYLKQVTLNGKAVEAVDGKLTITHAEGKQELAVTDQAGNVTTYTITVNNGHTFTEYVPDGNATCTQKGTKTATCKFCSAKDVVEDEMKEHTWDKGKVTREATETQKGTKTYTCSVCGKTKTEEIARKQAEVDTGDHSRIYLWMMLAGVAVIGIAGVYRKRRKEDK